MSRYSIDHDADFDLYYVVKNAANINFGTVVQITYTEQAARDWIKATQYEEDTEFFAEFG